MNTPQRTESLRDLVINIDKENIVLPEFQRDFVWEIRKTCELFDSIVKDIFIGSIIYGKPNFEITIREIDNRPRHGKGSRKKLKINSFEREEIKQKSQIANFRMILDGQQRATSIYRALKGIDEIWYIAKNEDELPEESKEKEIGDRTPEEMLYNFSLQEDEDRLSIKLSDAYKISNGAFFDKDIKNEFFDDLKYVAGMDNNELKASFRKYKIVCMKLGELFKSEVLLSYYLLDMDNEKFALFFERSNSKGIQLNFIDILAAKLYKGFNLRDKVEEIESKYPKYEFNREIIVRTISYIVSNGREVDRNYILTNLNYQHFNKYWDDVVKYYNSVLDFLFNEKLVISQSWMPYDNMVIPLIIFLKESNQDDFSQMQERQFQFIKYWYWGSIFSQRYSTGSNETIVQDSNVLKSVAHGGKINDRNFFSRLRPQINTYEDIFSYTKKVNVVYKGILNLINYNAHGLSDWNNSSKLTYDKKLEDHHIFPKEYIKRKFKNDEEALSLIDCVANRTLIPKITNIKVGKKAPSQYMSELKMSNHRLEGTLSEHLIPKEIIDGLYDEFFSDFIEDRSKLIFDLIKVNLITQESEILKIFYQAPKVEGSIKIFATYYNKKAEATLDIASQRVFYSGQNLSVSLAADKAKYILSGKANTSTNGWTFWKYLDENNQTKSINDFRK